MNKLAKAFMLAAGLGLASAEPALAVTVETRPIDQPDSVVQHQTTEPEETFLREIDPTKRQMIKTPRGIVVAPAPRIRMISACVEAPEEADYDTKALVMSFVITASKEDMEAKGITPQQFIETYAASIQESLDQVFDEVVARHNPADVLGATEAFVTDMAQSFDAWADQFEADEGVTLSIPWRPVGAFKDAPQCQQSLVTPAP